MTQLNMDFRKVLILIFLQTYGTINDISELIELTGVNYKNLKGMIIELNHEHYISYNEGLKNYKLSELGEAFLYNQYLNKVSLENLSIPSKTSDQTRESHVFIPKNFHKRFE